MKNVIKEKLIEVGDNDNKYIGENFTLAREFGTIPSGKKLNGQWVLRKINGEYVDFDTYRNDIAEQYDLELVKSEKNENN